MSSKCMTWTGSVVVSLVTWAAGAGPPQQAPRGIEGERSLPSRYAYVAADILRLCQPARGCWVDLGAGEGGVALALIEATGNPVLMIDPDGDALQRGLAAARDRKVADRLLAVIGTAEALPLPDNSVDLLASRGSIFFWNDPVNGLQEVQRVLRPGGAAYIGGGAGSGYPAEAVARLMAQRKAQLEGDDAEKWQRFVALRRPEQMRQWAQAAGLQGFEVLGSGALSADDPRVGQGVWLLFRKQP